MTGRPALAARRAALALALGLAAVALPAAAQPPGTASGDGPASAPAPDAAARGGPPWERVRIAVRVDAMPFAWRELRPGREGTAEIAADPGLAADPDHLVFDGFLYTLCIRAALHAGFSPELVPITAAARRAFLAGLEPGGTGAPPAPEVPAFDLLCDPTTLSLARMYRIEESERFVFSPIVFVANSSYVRPTGPVDVSGIEVDPAACRVHEDIEGDGRVVAGYVAGTTAEDGFLAAFERRALGPEVRSYCPVEFHSHRDGMAAICSGRLHAYFGDIDIISAYEREIAARPGRPCRLAYTRDFLIYEPYALLVGEGPDGFRPRFVRELYRLFSDGTVSDAFARYFPERRQSAALSMLFRINGVPMGRLPAAALAVEPPVPGVDGAPEPGPPNEPDIPPPVSQLGPGPGAARTATE